MYINILKLNFLILLHYQFINKYYFFFLLKDHITAHDLETDPALGLHEEQPDSWTPTVTKDVCTLF